MKGPLKTALSIAVLLEISQAVFSEKHALTNNEYTPVMDETNHGNATQLIRLSRNADIGRGMIDHDYQDVGKPKAKPWLGYYDFLITEGSYKFWVVFQLFTIGILIYSAFAAIYYAKYTINDYENYDDYFLKRSARSVPQEQTAFLGLPIETYVRIFNAIANYNDKYT